MSYHVTDTVPTYEFCAWMSDWCFGLIDSRPKPRDKHFLVCQHALNRIMANIEGPLSVLTSSNSNSNCLAVAQVVCFGACSFC